MTTQVYDDCRRASAAFAPRERALARYFMLDCAAMLLRRAGIYYPLSHDVDYRALEAAHPLMLTYLLTLLARGFDWNNVHTDDGITEDAQGRFYLRVPAHAAPLTEWRASARQRLCEVYTELQPDAPVSSRWLARCVYMRKETKEDSEEAEEEEEEDSEWKAVYRRAFTHSPAHAAVGQMHYMQIDAEQVLTWCRDSAVDMRVGAWSLLDAQVVANAQTRLQLSLAVHADILVRSDLADAVFDYAHLPPPPPPIQ